MRNNKMLRLASGMLVMTLLSTSVISGTFAKYVTTASASDTARVAKWGVKLQVIGNLFGDSYKDTIVADDTITVQSSDTTDPKGDVVAPGTKSNDNGLTFDLSGRPETAGKVKTVIKYQNIFLSAGSYGVLVPVDTATITADNINEYLESGAQALYYQKPGDAGYTEVTKTIADGWKTDLADEQKSATWAGLTGGKFYTLEDAVTLTDAYYPVVFSLDGSTKTEKTDTTSDSLVAVATALKDDLIDLSEAGDAPDKVSVEESDPTYDNLIQQYNSALEEYNNKVKELTDKVFKEEKMNGVTTYTINSYFDANENLATTLQLAGEKLTWAWDFGGVDEVANSDMADTILGNIRDLNNISGDPKALVVRLDDKDGSGSKGTYIAIGTDYYNLNVSFDISITAEQVD